MCPSLFKGHYLSVQTAVGLQRGLWRPMALLHEDLVGRVGLFGLWFTLCWGSDTTRV